MAKRDKRSLIGHDPLAWMNEIELAENATEENRSKELKEDDSGNLVSQAKLSILPVENNTSNKIILETTQTIQNVTQLQQRVIATLSQTDGSLEIDASAVKTIDTATMQLFVILKQEMIQLERELVFDFPSDKFVDAADLLGISALLGVDASASGFF
jgi:anti-anti-sigma regulatory factor